MLMNSTKIPTQNLILEVQSLSKIYGSKSSNHLLALDDINIELIDGEFVSVLGPSGCGKTTLMKILAGIESHSKGRVLLNGASASESKNVMGVVFQSPVLLPWLTVLENSLLPVRVLGLDRDKYFEIAIRLIELVGLTGFENKYPNQLSGGMQQRVSIVRALIHDPKVLLMDEPFGALDSLTRECMNVELQRIWLNNRKTVFFITHSVAESVFLSDRVLVMSARPGRIVEEIKIPFERPRSIDLMGDPEFGYLTRHLRSCLGGSSEGHD